MAIYYTIDKKSSLILCESEQDLFFSSDSSCNLASDFYRIVTGQDVSLPGEYIKMGKLLGVSGSDLLLALPKFAVRKHIENFRSSIEDVFSNPKNASYLKAYKKNHDFLGRLSVPFFNSKMVQSLAERQKFQTQSDLIKSFLNGSRTFYSMSGTVTGRLTVSKGPNILTCPSEIRSCMQSKKPSGKILQIDLISAEPQFALFVAGLNSPRDIYTHLSKSVFYGKLTRSQVKIATLCALYGQSPGKLSKNIDSSISASDAIDKIKNFFKFRKLKKRLVKDFQSKDFRNHLGRPLRTDREDLLVSHYLQSSVAEASISMFSDFCSDNPNISPIYLIHDALIVDADQSFVDGVSHGDTIELKYCGQKFYASISFLDGD